ncbi:MAG: 50S ribosomal protein L11 methyltransferase [Acetobacteraceae bacterium]
MRRSGRQLETLRVTLPERAIAVYRAALEPHALSVAWFDAGGGRYLVEAVRERGRGEAALELALALAAAASGIAAPPRREPAVAEGWLARMRAAFPDQEIGRRFLIRSRQTEPPLPGGRIVLVLEAGMAFGSGEHASTRGCLLALERLAARRPRRLLDLGTGSGVLALAAARLWHRSVLAIDSDPDAVRTARRNARMNGSGSLVRVEPGGGWHAPAISRASRYDLVMANILARPLMAMARALTSHLAPGGRAVLSGLTAGQVPMVLAAHRRSGLVLARRITLDGWTTLILRAPSELHARL